MNHKINIASVDMMHSIEELIYGDLAVDKSNFGPDLKYTEYNKIYKYKGKYYRAYKYLYRANGIYAPDNEHFMVIQLGDLSNVMNKINDTTETNTGGIYLPPYTTLYNEYFRTVFNDTNVKYDKPNYFDNTTNTLITYKLLDKGTGYTYTTDGTLVDDKGRIIDLNKFAIITSPTGVTSDDGTLRLSYKETYVKKIRKMYRDVPKERQNTGWFWAVFGGIAATIAIVATGGLAAAPILGAVAAGATIVGASAAVGHTVDVLTAGTVPDGYERQFYDEEYDALVRTRIWIDKYGRYVRDYNGESVSNSKSTPEIDYVTPDMVPVIATDDANGNKIVHGRVQYGVPEFTKRYVGMIDSVKWYYDTYNNILGNSYRVENDLKYWKPVAEELLTSYHNIAAGKPFINASTGLMSTITMPVKNNVIFRSPRAVTGKDVTPNRNDYNLENNNRLMRSGSMIALDIKSINSHEMLPYQLAKSTEFLDAVDLHTTGHITFHKGSVLLTDSDTYNPWGSFGLTTTKLNHLSKYEKLLIYLYHRTKKLQFIPARTSSTKTFTMPDTSSFNITDVLAPANSYKCTLDGLKTTPVIAPKPTTKVHSLEAFWPNLSHEWIEKLKDFYIVNKNSQIYTREDINSFMYDTSNEHAVIPRYVLPQTAESYEDILYRKSSFSINTLGNSMITKNSTIVNDLSRHGKVLISIEKAQAIWEYQSKIAYYYIRRSSENSIDTSFLPDNQLKFILHDEGLHAKHTENQGIFNATTHNNKILGALFPAVLLELFGIHNYLLNGTPVKNLSGLNIIDTIRKIGRELKECKEIIKTYYETTPSSPALNFMYYYSDASKQKNKWDLMINHNCYDLYNTEAETPLSEYDINFFDNDDGRTLYESNPTADIRYNRSIVADSNLMTESVIDLCELFGNICDNLVYLLDKYGYVPTEWSGGGTPNEVNEFKYNLDQLFRFIDFIYDYMSINYKDMILDESKVYGNIIKHNYLKTLNETDVINSIYNNYHKNIFFHDVPIRLITYMKLTKNKLLRWYFNRTDPRGSESGTDIVPYTPFLDSIDIPNKIINTDTPTEEYKNTDRGNVRIPYQSNLYYNTRKIDEETMEVRQ